MRRAGRSRVLVVRGVQSMSFRTLQWNDALRPFVWKKTAEEILDSLARYLQRISGGEH